MIQPIQSMENAFSLAGKTALVTGGNRGLGRAVAEAMAQAGADVAILCRDAAAGEEALEALRGYGRRAEGFYADITDLPALRAALDAAYGAFGNFDILVNNSGTSCRTTLLEMDEDLTEWHKVIDTNLNGTVRMTYEVGKRMRDAGRGGCIINMTSISGSIVNKTQAMSPYSASKAALNHFTHCMASEMGGFDIRVNAIAPGFTHTELSRFIPEDAFAYITQQTSLGRFGEPIEVGALAVFLASPAAAQITGAVVTIDGGYSLLV